jgi:hypothetical protein
VNGNGLAFCGLFSGKRSEVEMVVYEWVFGDSVMDMYVSVVGDEIW